MHEGADDRPDGRAQDAQLGAEHDRAEDDAGVVEDRREPVGQEALADDEHLAEREGRREDDRGHAHDPEQLGVLGSLLRVEPRRHDVDGLRGEDEQDPDRDDHHRDRRGQDRAGEILGRARVLVAEAREDGDERGRQAGDDEDVQCQLGQDERGVVDVELAAGAEGARERPVADEAHDVGREREAERRSAPRGRTSRRDRGPARAASPPPRTPASRDGTGSPVDASTRSRRVRRCGIITRPMSG